MDSGQDRTHQLGDLQHAIMEVLWEVGEATVARVHELLSDAGHERALTTIATMLTKMERKGVVAHRVDGRHFVYRAKVTREAVTRSMVGELTRRLFAGKASSLVAHLLEDQEIEPQELARLRRLIAERQATEDRSRGGPGGATP